MSSVSNSRPVSEDVNAELADQALAAGRVEPVTEEFDRTNAADATETIRMIGYGRLKADHGRNPRTADRYTAAGEAGAKARSLLQRGLIRPLLVSEREDGSLWILQGHIRHAAIGLIRTVGLPAGTPKTEKPAVAAIPDFMDKVKCSVLKGLSLKDELDLVMDHGESFPLNKREKYDAAKKLLNAGFSENFVFKKLGMKSRSPVSKLNHVSKMPACVEAMYVMDPKAEGYIDITDTVIDTLYVAYNKDKANGCRLKTEGPEFTKLWEDFLANGPSARAKMIPRTKVLEKAERETDVDFREVLEAIANGDEELLASAAERVRERLAQIPIESLGSDLTDTVS